MRIQNTITSINNRYLSALCRWAVKTLNIPTDVSVIRVRKWKGDGATAKFRQYRHFYNPYNSKVSFNGIKAKQMEVKKEEVVWLFLGNDCFTEPYTEETAFKIVLAIGAVLRPRSVPEGDMGHIRQPIGAEFVKQKDLLLSQWKHLIATSDQTTDDAVNCLHKKLEKAKDKLRIWSKKKKRAMTKTNMYHRRVCNLEVKIKEIEEDYV